jgi:hypothetical protein
MAPAVFVDTFYWVTVLSPRDPFHARVLAWGRNRGMTRLFTTDEILTEVLNWFSGSGPYWRAKVAALVHDVRSDPNVDVLLQTHADFRLCPRPVRSPAGQELQFNRLPVDARAASARHLRDINQRSSLHARRIHDLVSVALMCSPKWFQTRFRAGPTRINTR